MSELNHDQLLGLDNQLCFKLYAASRAVIRLYRPLLDELDLTYPQYLVMLVLWEWAQRPPVAPTVRALGERLYLDSGTLTPLLKRLQTRGLISRDRSTRDEREVVLGLTEAGLALRDRAACVPAALLNGAGVGFEELGRLRRDLDRLLAALSPA